MNKITQKLQARAKVNLVDKENNATFATRPAARPTPAKLYLTCSC
jgi:hypothetical protein